MTTPLPDSLVRFGFQLEAALEHGQRARRRRRIVLRMATATATAAAVAAGVVWLTSADSTLAPPGIATASAAERAAAVLSPAGGSIVHDVASYRQISPDGHVSTWRDESWLETSRPYARREQITRDGGAPTETATVGEGPTQFYDVATNTIYTNPPAGAPALGTPMPASDGDPLVKQLVSLLRSGDASAVRHSTVGGRAVTSFAYKNPLPGGGTADWSYVVDANTFQPLHITTTSPDGLSTSARFVTYEALKPTKQTKSLLSLRAQHPGATIDSTSAGYQAAQARMSRPATRGR